jgi:4-amino-4-deoxy-L-arabinose transferase-like glycosyltransferase
MSGNLMYDETTHLACAETIDLRPGTFNLVWRSVDHPWMSVYVVKLSSVLFGSSPFGLRILHVLVGTATVMMVFYLGAAVGSPRAGLLAAALLAVDRFHMTWSYFFCPEVLLLFFTTAVLLQFFRATASGSRRDFLLLGLYVGLAYTAKETGFLLVPVLWLCVLTDAQRRRYLRSVEWYVMHAAALVVVLPDVVYNVVYFYEGYFYRDAMFIARSFRLSYSAVLLYLGEVVAYFTASEGGYSTMYDTQNPALCHWPAGVLYLTAVALAVVGSVRRWSDWPSRVLTILFVVIFGFFTLMPAEIRTLYWWPSISLIAAVVLAGRVFARSPKWIVVPFLSYLLIQAVLTARRPGVETPRRSAAEIQAAETAAARNAPGSEALGRLERRLMHAVHIGGPNAELYYHLARIAHQHDRPGRASYFIGRCLTVDANHAPALALEKKIAAGTS